MAGAGPEGGGTGGLDPPPLKNHQNIGFLSKTGPDPLKNHKPTKQHSMLGHHRHASNAGGPMKAHFSGIWIHSLTKKQ